MNKRKEAWISPEVTVGGLRIFSGTQRPIFFYSGLFLHLFGGGLGNFHKGKFQAAQYFD